MLTLLASLSLSAPAFAAWPRPTESVFERGALVVAWSMDDPGSAAILSRARELSRRTGVEVLSINIDSADEMSRLGPWLRIHHCDLPTLTDADGGWQRLLGLHGPDVVLLGGRAGDARRIDPEDALAAIDAIEAVIGTPRVASASR